ncbi:ubiquitin-specific protease ESD4 [Trifolium repens]|nr:ubiquitin-specific protease ESD4 [Trifolium repens]
MNDQGSHWFLLVVDFNERKCYWLDSAPSEERHHPRRHSIIRMQLKLEEILFDPSYKLMNLIGHDNLITNFTIVQPSRFPHQRPGSSNYENITVVTATRLKLALYLCHSSNNVLLKPLLTKAARYWSDMERKRKALVNV